LSQTAATAETRKILHEKEAIAAQLRALQAQVAAMIIQKLFFFYDLFAAAN
jgi:hypothetical protein